MKVFSYNKEPVKKEKSYIGKAVVYGLILAVGLILLVKGSIYLVQLIIEYWVWIVAVIGTLYIAKRFLGRKKPAPVYPVQPPMSQEVYDDPRA